jgi:hypothetical protein
MSRNLIDIDGGDCHDDGNDEENNFKPFINHTVYTNSTEVLLLEQGGKILPMVMVVVVMVFMLFRHKQYKGQYYNFLKAK